MRRTVERARTPPAGRLPAWHPVRAAALVLAAIIGLATIPIWATRRANVLRTEIETISEPGRRQADSLIVALAAKTAASRAYAASGDRIYRDAFITYQEETRNASESLYPLARAAGPRAAALHRDLDRNVQLLGRWQDGLINATMSQAEFVASLPVQDSLYGEALDGALLIEQEFVREAAARRTGIRRLEILTLLTAVLLAGIAAVGTFGVVRLASQQRRLANRLSEGLQAEEELRAELMRVAESRARLVRGFSHDMKNPLGAADGYAQLLEEGVVGPLSEDQMRAISRIRQSIHSALLLIDDLVELVRAEAGQLELERAETDLPELTGELLDTYRAAASGRGITIEPIRAGTVPRIESDPGRVRQILGNVVSNAIKYSPPGGRISVVVESLPEDDAGRPGPWVAVRVTDTGPGIPADKHEAIFTAFTRLAPGATPGVGLGLAISRTLARLLGGDLTVASEVGKGSTFTLWLPTRRATEEPAPQVVPRAA